MILVFDLDDTLYEEMAYVRSGFKAVAAYGEREFGLNSTQSFDFMITHLATNGRGRVFDDWLTRGSAFSKKRLSDCIRVYRHHSPDISLSSDTEQLLIELKSRGPLYLVTDGHKVVQKRKLESLNLEWLFKRVFLTHRFGLRNSKPSLHCFKIIRRIEGVSWSDMIYIGDNPAKDFINLKGVGAVTIRVRTGAFADVIASPDYDSAITINSLADLSATLKSL